MEPLGVRSRRCHEGLKLACEDLSTLGADACLDESSGRGRLVVEREADQVGDQLVGSG